MGMGFLRRSNTVFASGLGPTHSDVFQHGGIKDLRFLCQIPDVLTQGFQTVIRQILPITCDMTALWSAETS